MITNSISEETVEELVTKEKYQDLHLSLEFNLAKNANSAIYFQKRYRLNISDAYGAGSVWAHDMGYSLSL